MKRYIQSAKYTKYNANTRGNNSPDCVKRALSMAFDIEYNNVGRELNKIMHEKHADVWNIKRVYDVFISNHGGSMEYSVSVHPLTGESLDNFNADMRKQMTVEYWIDNLGTSGVYILETCKKPNVRGQGDHLTCVIEGQLFDSWDSRNQYVCGFYIVEGRAALAVTGIEDELPRLRNLGSDLINEQAEKHMKQWHGNDREFSILLYQKQLSQEKVPGMIDGYSIKYPCRFTINIYEQKLTYDFTVTFVFSPTTNVDEAEKKIKELAKIRMYDRFYAIKTDLKKKEEAYELSKQLGDSDEKSYLWLSPQEERFLNTLPGWIRPLVTYIYINMPGQYHDSYSLTIKPLPGDPNKDKVSFEGYNASDIREEVRRYKEWHFARLYEDYSLDEVTG